MDEIRHKLDDAWERRRQRMADVPDPEKHPWRYRLVKLRWRLALAAAVHPIQVAVIVALAAVSIPLWMVIDQGATLKTQGNALREADRTGRENDRRLGEVVRQIQENRKQTVGDVCRGVNRNAKGINRQVDYFRSLIIGGAKQSLIFEDIYQGHGAPPYEARLKQARQQAADLDKLSIPVLDCKKLRTNLP